MGINNEIFKYKKLLNIKNMAYTLISILSFANGHFAIAISILKDRKVNHSRQNKGKDFKCD